MIGAFFAGASILLFMWASAVFVVGDSSRDIAFLSEESMTIEGAPVANQIHFERRGDEDIWMMNQSHHGARASAGAWDRIAIGVNREKKQAKFYQFQPGDLKWPSAAETADFVNLKETEFKVSCTICHSNGTRAIRPLSALNGGSMSMGERFQIWRWNQRIKWYGRVQNEANAEVGEKPRAIPMRFAGTYANAPLKVGVCIVCHRNAGPFAHGILTRQNAMTIKHMINAGHMPMFGIRFTTTERKEIEDFLSGH